jgi:hypothetical protein
LGIVASLTFLPACAGQQEGEAVPPEREKIETEAEAGAAPEGEVLDPRFNTLEGYTVEQRESFEQEAGQMVAEYETWITQLEQQASVQTDEEIRNALNEHIAGLRQQRDLLQQQLDELQAADGDAWQELKLDVMTSLESFERSFDEAAATIG